MKLRLNKNEVIVEDVCETKTEHELKWANNKPYISVNQIGPNQIELGIDELKNRIPFWLKLGLFKINPELEEDLWKKTTSN